MLGGIAGDIIGSVYEKANYRAKDFEPLVHHKARFTDDTVCIVAVADALVNGIAPAQALQTWGRRYEHIGGWGQRFALWLCDDDPQPYGSWGNGGAMRVAPTALLARSIDEALGLAHQVTVVTHDHPEGIKGAQATAASIWLARQGETADAIRMQLSSKRPANSILDRPRRRCLTLRRWPRRRAASGAAAAPRSGCSAAWAAVSGRP